MRQPIKKNCDFCQSLAFLFIFFFFCIRPSVNLLWVCHVRLRPRRTSLQKLSAYLCRLSISLSFFLISILIFPFLTPSFGLCLPRVLYLSKPASCHLFTSCLSRRPHLSLISETSESPAQTRPSLCVCMCVFAALFFWLFVCKCGPNPCWDVVVQNRCESLSCMESCYRVRLGSGRVEECEGGQTTPLCVWVCVWHKKSILNMIHWLALAYCES